MTKATWRAVQRLGWVTLTDGKVSIPMTEREANVAAEWLNHYRHFAS